MVGMSDAAQSELLAAIENDGRLQIVPDNAKDPEAFIQSGEMLAYLRCTQSDKTVICELLYSSITEPKVEKARLIFHHVVSMLNDSTLNEQGIASPWSVNDQEVVVTSASGSKVDYVDWLVPGVLVHNIFMGCVFGLGMAVVRDRINDKYRKLATTPISKNRFALILASGRLVMMVAQVLVIMLVAWILFGVTVQGSLIMLFLACVLCMLVFLVFGFLVSSICHTVEKSLALSNGFFILVSVLSGVFFSNQHFPAALKWAAYFLPATPAVDLVRGLYVFGGSILDYPMQLALLIAWLVIGLVISSKLFTWYDD
jgi:ABC-type multidrug transport system permease subunit